MGVPFCVRRVLRGVAACALLLGMPLAFAARTPPLAPASPEGERIYREGMLPGGAPLLGQRHNAPDVSGKDAACANCHGRSGMGVVEGRVVIPPITAPALFHPGERLVPSGGHEHLHLLPTPNNRPAYTDETLARAIREGVSPDGRALDFLMPRFALDDASMRALLAQLHHLSSGHTPGAVNDQLNFATIITPDADPVAREAMVRVLQEYFAQKDDFTHDDKAPIAEGSSQRRFRVQRRWVLQVWQLAGPPETWERQLDERMRAEPVFAVISGLGGKTWAPVHAFCEREAVPCLFPNTDLPVVNEDDFYPVYFTRGVLLEADLIAARIAAGRAAGDTAGPAVIPAASPAAGAAAGPGARSAGAEPRAARVVQVYRKDDIGAAAAQALRRALAATGLSVVDRALEAKDGAPALARALAALKAGDALVLWLRATDLALLPPKVPSAAAVLVSGLLGGLEDATLPEAWRPAVRMSYVLALPEERSLLLNYALGWLRAHHIPLTRSRVQIDTYIACSILAENLVSTHGAFLRDFLIERTEATVGSDLFNGNFKRLSLAAHQRFASKGGYFVRFTGPTGNAIAADGEWTIP